MGLCCVLLCGVVWCSGATYGANHFSLGLIIIKSEVPDVRGMGARDAVYVLESLGLLVELEGEGQVRRQSINPGANATEQKIKIYLD